MEHITVDKLIEKRKEWEDYRQTLKSQQKENFSFYELSYDANIPTNLGYEQKTPSTARDWVDVGIMNYTLDKPQCIVRPRNESDIARNQATMLEHFYNYWLNRMILEIKENAKKLLIMGECFFKLAVDDTYYGIKTTDMTSEELEEFQEKRSSLFPLRVECPNPINVTPSPAIRGFWHPEYIEYYEMTVAQAEELCDRNEWSTSWKAGKKSTQTVKYTVYYSDKDRCVLIDDIPILPRKVEPNWLGFTPYVHIPSGYGVDSYEGKPEYKYRSIFHGKKDMIKLETRVLSQGDAINARWAWPIVKVGGDEKKIEHYYGRKGKSFSISPNEVLVQPDGVTIELIQGQQPPPAFFQHMALVSSMAQPPPVFTGQARGVYSGYGEVVRMANAKPIYKDPFKSLEDGLSVLMGMGARVMENILKYKINVGVKDLEPSKIKGYYENSVQLLAEPPEAADMRKTLGVNLFVNKVISDLYNKIHYQNMTLEEALEDQAQQLADKAQENPQILSILILDAMKRLGMEQAPEVLQALQGQTIPAMSSAAIPTGAQSVPQYQRMGQGLETGPFPQEQNIGQVPLGQ